VYSARRRGGNLLAVGCPSVGVIFDDVISSFWPWRVCVGVGGVSLFCGLMAVGSAKPSALAAAAILASMAQSAVSLGAQWHAKARQPAAIWRRGFCQPALN